jgi:hypothetical protein
MWDTVLQNYASDGSWTGNSYSDETRNCYDFVLGFLQLMTLDQIEPSITNKSDFCRKFVVPHTARIAKYISLYRRLLKEATVVQYSTAF